jgi:hypothetical protein
MFDVCLYTCFSACLSVCRPMRSAAAARWASATESAVGSFLSPHIFCFAVSLFRPFSPLFVSVSLCILRDRTTPSPSPFPQPLCYCNYYYHHHFYFLHYYPHSQPPTTSSRHLRVQQSPHGVGRHGAAAGQDGRLQLLHSLPAAVAGHLHPLRLRADRGGLDTLRLCSAMLCSALSCSILQADIFGAGTGIVGTGAAGTGTRAVYTGASSVVTYLLVAPNDLSVDAVCRRKPSSTGGRSTGSVPPGVPTIISVFLTPALYILYTTILFLNN